MDITSRTRILACDFETTVYEGQDHTEVWSAAYAELYRDNVKVFHSIIEFLNDLFSYRVNLVCYFHNLKFDGHFIIDYLLKNGWEFTNAKKPDTRQFKTSISRQNRWYYIILNTGNGIIEIRDSVKLMPMTLAQVGEAFNTEHRKKEMVYEGYRYAGCKITPEEMEYIINDVLVLKEALEYMLKEGHNKLTIGSCALNEFKNGYSRNEYKVLFPDLTEVKTPDYLCSNNCYEFIRKTYKGAYCYLKEDKVGKHHDGVTYDVNGLYSAVMHSNSGNYYPIGKPRYFQGNVPDKCNRKDIIYFVMIKCSFTLKENMLPTLQIKGDIRYRGNEWLKTSDILYKGKYYKEYVDRDGNILDSRPTLYLTKEDYILLFKHYNVTDIEHIGGCWFYGRKGLFDDYINYWSLKKENAKTKAERTEAKYFLNNLYGKFATSTDSSYQEPFILDSVINFNLVEEDNKTPGYIAIGSMVTSYARKYTLTAAQLNYDNFIYADTDSLHMTRCEVKGIVEDEKELGKWKLESEWSTGIFLRQKTYCEFVRKENHKKVTAHWDIKCCGMPEKSKKLLLATRPITCFDYGLQIGGKLVPKRIDGGVILEEKQFTLRKKA